MQQAFKIQRDLNRRNIHRDREREREREREVCVCVCVCVSLLSCLSTNVVFSLSTLFSSLLAPFLAHRAAQPWTQHAGHTRATPARHQNRRACANDGTCRSVRIILYLWNASTTWNGDMLCMAGCVAATRATTIDDVRRFQESAKGVALAQVVNRTHGRVRLGGVQPHPF